MPDPKDFLMTDEYDPGEVFYAKTAEEMYSRFEEVWQEDYAASLMTTEEANAKDYYAGLYRFIDEISWRMKTAAMCALERGEWKELWQ